MRVMFFRHPGTNSRCHLLDMQRGFERAGFDTIGVELGPMWKSYEHAGPNRLQMMDAMTAYTSALMKANGVGLSIGMWANGLVSHAQFPAEGRAVSVFELAGIPHLMWWLDAPQWAHEGQVHEHFRSPLFAGNRIHHMINSAATGREMSEVLGFRTTHAMPYGIDERLFRPVAGVRPEFDLVFGLGPGDPPPTDRMLRELESDDPDFDGLRRSQAERVREQVRRWACKAPGDGRPLAALLDALVDSQIVGWRTPMLLRLDQIVAQNPELQAGRRLLMSDASEYVKVTSMIRGIESFRRPFLISYLARRFRCAVFGSGELAGWPCPAERLGHLKYGEMSAAYARARVGLNVMRWQDDAGCNIKPLEISASGRPCLMADRPGIAEVLTPGREIAVFTTPREACERLRELIEAPDVAAGMAEAAMERVRSQHTWTQRAREIVERVCPPVAAAA